MLSYSDKVAPVDITHLIPYGSTHSPHTTRSGSTAQINLITLFNLGLLNPFAECVIPVFSTENTHFMPREIVSKTFRFSFSDFILVGFLFWKIQRLEQITSLLRNLVLMLLCSSYLNFPTSLFLLLFPISSSLSLQVYILNTARGRSDLLTSPHTLKKDSQPSNHGHQRISSLSSSVITMTQFTTQISAQLGLKKPDFMKI